MIYNEMYIRIIRNYSLALLNILDYQYHEIGPHFDFKRAKLTKGLRQRISLLYTRTTTFSQVI